MLQVQLTQWHRQGIGLSICLDKLLQCSMGFLFLEFKAWALSKHNAHTYSQAKNNSRCLSSTGYGTDQLFYSPARVQWLQIDCRLSLRYRTFYIHLPINIQALSQFEELHLNQNSCVVHTLNPHPPEVFFCNTGGLLQPLPGFSIWNAWWYPYICYQCIGMDLLYISLIPKWVPLNFIWRHHDVKVGAPSKIWMYWKYTWKLANIIFFAKKL